MNIKKEKFAVSTLTVKRDGTHLWERRSSTYDEVCLILTHNGCCPDDVEKALTETREKNEWILVNEVCQIC